MYLRPCPSCGNSVSTKAASCPRCGHPFVEKNKGGITFWGVVGAVIVAVIILSFD